MKAEYMKLLDDREDMTIKPLYERNFVTF